MGLSFVVIRRGCDMDESTDLYGIFDDNYHLLSSLSSVEVGLMTWKQLLLASDHVQNCEVCNARLGNALFAERWRRCPEPDDSGSESTNPESGSSS